jgi:hypothetical protein
VVGVLARHRAAEFLAYLAVQDGMTAADVVPHLPRHDGIFVEDAVILPALCQNRWDSTAPSGPRRDSAAQEHLKGLQCVDNT